MILTLPAGDLLLCGRLIPLNPGTKKPWVRSYADASNHPAQLAKWARTKPNCDFGLVIDADDLIVLDCEGPGKGNGRRSIDWAEVDAGKRLPDGPVATTPSGGEHLYFRLPAKYIGKIRNWTRVLAGLDIRIKKGMVAIPPAARREWIESFDDVALPILPDWFCELLLEGTAVQDTPAAVERSLKAHGLSDRIECFPDEVSPSDLFGSVQVSGAPE